jgi:hypothetical protein
MDVGLISRSQCPRLGRTVGLSVIRYITYDNLFATKDVNVRRILGKQYLAFVTLPGFQ